MYTNSVHFMILMTSVNVTELRQCLPDYLKPVQEGKAALNRIEPVKHTVISTTRCLSLPMKTACNAGANSRVYP